MSDTEIQKLEIIEWIASLQDKALIKELVRWKEEHQQMSLTRYNEEIEAADKEIESGNFLTHEEAVSEIRSWRARRAKKEPGDY